ncbi:DUF397 domain-containing protein [Streptomyces bobili]|uniref:DUF397 domain-containing protein n=1 Tax=Streptomyces bobili TaxID=67280 RepID=UPI0037A93F2F
MRASRVRGAGRRRTRRGRLVRPCGGRPPTSFLGNCLEVADGHPGPVPVRDSKVPDGEVLVFGAASWAAFLTHTARG